MSNELRVLVGSAAGGVVFATVGVIWGLAASAQVILFDGIYALLGVALSGLAAAAAYLASSGPSQRYPFGREAFVPLAVAAQGFALLGVCAYAVVDAVSTILDGGSIPDAGSGLLYSCLSCAGALVVFALLRRAIGRSSASDLIRAESAQWAASALLSFGILVGFAAILALDGSPWDDAGAYVDSTMVILASASVIPTALGLVRGSVGELVEVAPSEWIQAPMHAAVASTVERYDLTEPTVRMSKLGRKLYLEVDVLLPTNHPMIGSADAVRQDLMRQVDSTDYDVWLNLELHVDPAWDD